MPETPSHQINLLDFLAFLLRWRRFLITVVVAVAVFVGIVSFVVKPVFRSTAIVHSAERSSEGFGGFVASRLAALSGISGAAAGAMFGDTPAEMYIQILRSRWMNEKLIETFDLRKIYDLQEQPIETVIDAVKAHTRFELDARSMALVVYSEDSDPRRSQAITQFLVDELDKRNQELRSTSARREREFIGQRLVEARQTLATLEDSLARYQLATGVLNPTEQVKATLAAAAELEAQRLTVQTELEMNRQIFDPRNPEVAYLRLKLASLDSTLQTLNRVKSEGAKGFNALMRLQDSPQAALSYFRLTRDIEVQQLLVSFLIQQFEQAKIEEQRNTPTIMRVDPPVIATRKVWPQRSMMVAIGAFAAFIVGVLFALLREFLVNAARDPGHPQHQRVVNLQQSWSRKTV